LLLLKIGRISFFRVLIVVVDYENPGPPNRAGRVYWPLVFIYIGENHIIPEYLPPTEK
jgi:hypothetical protein